MHFTQPSISAWSAYMRPRKTNIVAQVHIFGMAFMVDGRYGCECLPAECRPISKDSCDLLVGIIWNRLFCVARTRSTDSAPNTSSTGAGWANQYSFHSTLAASASSACIYPPSDAWYNSLHGNDRPVDIWICFVPICNWISLREKQEFSGPYEVSSNREFGCCSRFSSYN